jgi:hypothetical protein
MLARAEARQRALPLDKKDTERPRRPTFPRRRAAAHGAPSVWRGGRRSRRGRRQLGHEELRGHAFEHAARVGFREVGRRTTVVLTIHRWRSKLPMGMKEVVTVFTEHEEISQWLMPSSFIGAMMHL